MEVKINKEIRNYTESMFFGLSLTVHFFLFVWAWIKSEFLMPKKLMFLPDNLYYETMKPTIEAHEKGLPTIRKKQKGRTSKQKKNRKKKNAKRSKEVNNAENS